MLKLSTPCCRKKAAVTATKMNIQSVAAIVKCFICEISFYLNSYNKCNSQMKRVLAVVHFICEKGARIRFFECDDRDD